MNKATIIFIAIIYIGSIAIINLFGMEMAVYNKEIPVSSIICINESDDNLRVIDKEGQSKTLWVDFTEAYDKNTNTGTYIQIKYRVLPDNASIKGVTFVCNHDNPRYEFDKHSNGEYTGLVFFYKPAIISDVKIMSTDGRKVYTTVTLVARVPSNVKGEN